MLERYVALDNIPRQRLEVLSLQTILARTHFEHLDRVEMHVRRSKRDGSTGMPIVG